MTASYTVIPYLYPNNLYRTQIRRNNIPIATTINAYDYNAGCGIMASVNEARVLILALEYQDFEAGQRQLTRARDQPPIARLEQNTRTASLSTIKALHASIRDRIVLMWPARKRAT